MQKVNFDHNAIREARLLQLNELQEWRFLAYENSKIHEEKMKACHENCIRRREFRVGQKVLLFNMSTIVLGNLRSR